MRYRTLNNVVNADLASLIFDPLAARSTLQTSRGRVTYYRLAAPEEAGLVKLE